MQPSNAFGVPVDIKVQPTDLDESKAVSRFELKTDVAKQLVILGAAQIALGALSVVSEVVCVALYTTSDLVSLFFVGYGFWIGVIFIVTGIFGILAGKQRSRCHTLLFNIFSIISASLTVFLFSLSLASAIMSGTSRHTEYVYPTTPPGTTDGRYSYGQYSDGHYEYVASRYPNAQKAAIVMESLMAVVAIVEATVAIRSSLKVRKIPNSCCRCKCDGCFPEGENSSRPSVVICRMGNCFCHCVSSCCLPQNSALDQLAMIGSGGPPTASTISEQQEEISTSDGSAQPAIMDSVQPIFFYPAVSDQQLMIDDPILQGQGISDHAKLIGQ